MNYQGPEFSCCKCRCDKENEDCRGHGHLDEVPAGDDWVWVHECCTHDHEGSHEPKDCWYEQKTARPADQSRS